MIVSEFLTYSRIWSCEQPFWNNEKPIEYREGGRERWAEVGRSEEGAGQSQSVLLLGRQKEGSMLGASLRAVGRLCSVRGGSRGIRLFFGSCTTLILLPPLATAATAPTFRFSSSISHYSDTNYRRDTNAYSVFELALDSVVKVFTVSSSPNYLLPWQNKSQREIMGSGILLFLIAAFLLTLLYSPLFALQCKKLQAFTLLTGNFYFFKSY